MQDHSELVAVLTEFYTLLDDLAILEPDSVTWPSPETGLHPPGLINDTSAGGAVYYPEAINMMHALPILENAGLEIAPSTRVISYTGVETDVAAFLDYRVMLGDEENLMPGSAVQLSWGDSIYGIHFICDTADSR